MKHKMIIYFLSICVLISFCLFLGCNGKKNMSGKKKRMSSEEEATLTAINFMKQYCKKTGLNKKIGTPGSSDDIQKIVNGWEVYFKYPKMKTVYIVKVNETNKVESVIEKTAWPNREEISQIYPKEKDRGDIKN